MSPFKMGWIYPDGLIVELADYQMHFETLLSDPLALKFFPDFGAYSEIDKWAETQYNEAYYDFVDYQNQTDNYCGWHNFNTYKDDFLCEIIYDTGFMRFGSWRNTLGEMEVEIESRVHPDDSIALKLMDKIGGEVCNCRTRPKSYYTKSKLKKVYRTNREENLI